MQEDVLTDWPQRVYQDGPCFVTRHGYAAKGAHVYIELLTISSPSAAPQGVSPFVIHRYSTTATREPGHDVWSFEHFEAAEEAWENLMSVMRLNAKDQFEKVDGYIRHERFPLNVAPWFMPPRGESTS